MISLQSLKRHLSLRPVLLGMKYIMLHPSYRETRHPRRTRGSQSGREKRRSKKQFSSKGGRAPGCRPLLNYFQTVKLTVCKECFVLLCPIDKHHLLSSFGVFVHDSYCLANMILVWLLHQRNTRCQESFSSI